MSKDIATPLCIRKGLWGRHVMLGSFFTLCWTRWLQSDKSLVIAWRHGTSATATNLGTKIALKKSSRREEVKYVSLSIEQVQGAK